MEAKRGRIFKRLIAADKHGRLLLRHPWVGDQPKQGVMVHAKLMVVDDKLLRVGSANLCNRSLGLDTECDLAIGRKIAAFFGHLPAPASFPTFFPLVALDRILITSGQHLSETHIHNSRLARFASDHYPVVAAVMTRSRCPVVCNPNPKPLNNVMPEKTPVP